MKHFDNIIIGAGLAGLHLCSLLKDNETLIIEKSRGVGGRMATRRISDLPVDHGVQFISKSLNFIKMEEHPLHGYYSLNGMTNLAKKLAEGLSIEKNQKITELSYSSIWRIKTESGDIFTANKIILTAPLPQSVDLLKANQLLNKEQELHLSQIKYHKMIQGIFILEEIPSEMKSFQIQDFRISLMREKNLHPKALLLSLNSQLSEVRFEFTDEENLVFLQERFKNQFPGKLKINHLELKKWRYSTPVMAMQESYYELPNQLYLIGDAFLFPDVRGAILSAEALANHLNQELK